MPPAKKMKKKKAIARHPCPICGKLFQAPSKVRRHVAEFHEGRKRVGRNSGKRKKPATPARSEKGGGPKNIMRAKKRARKTASTPSPKSARGVARTHFAPDSDVEDNSASSSSCSSSSSSLSSSSSSSGSGAEASSSFVSTDKKVHPCPYRCGKYFARPSKAQRHADEVHDNKARTGRTERIPCPFEKCTKTYSRQDALNVHVNTVHFNRKPYACDVCDKQFGEKGNLKRHKTELHRGVKRRKGQAQPYSNRIYVQHSQRYGTVTPPRRNSFDEPEPNPSPSRSFSPKSPRAMEELACTALVSLSSATTEIAVSALIGLATH